MCYVAFHVFVCLSVCVRECQGGAVDLYRYANFKSAGKWQDAGCVVWVRRRVQVCVLSFLRCSLSRSLWPLATRGRSFGYVTWPARRRSLWRALTQSRSRIDTSFSSRPQQFIFLSIAFTYTYLLIYSDLSVLPFDPSLVHHQPLSLILSHIQPVSVFAVIMRLSTVGFFIVAVKNWICVLLLLSLSLRVKYTFT